MSKRTFIVFGLLILVLAVVSVTFTVLGPKTVDSRAIDCSGTDWPLLLRTCRREMSPMSLRSTWTFAPPSRLTLAEWASDAVLSCRVEAHDEARGLTRRGMAGVLLRDHEVEVARPVAITFQRGQVGLAACDLEVA